MTQSRVWRSHFLGDEACGILIREILNDVSRLKVGRHRYNGNRDDKKGLALFTPDPILPRGCSCSFLDRSMKVMSAMMLSLRRISACRSVLSYSRSYATSSSADLKAVDSRWLSQTTNRIGKCLAFGVSNEQCTEAAGVTRQLAEDWRDLFAGSEGFLTGKGRTGLWRHPVVWGEQVGLVWGEP